MVVNKHQLSDICLVNHSNMCQTILLFLSVIKDMHTGNTCDSNELNIFLKCEGYNHVFLAIFRDLEAFYFLQVVWFAYLFCGQVDFMNLEILENANHFGSEVEKVD